MIWEDATISRFATEGEKEASNKVRCLTKRVALNVKQNVSLYSVPDDVITIRRVTWKGKKLDPKPFRGYLQYPVVDPASTIGGFEDSFTLAFDTDSSNSTPQGPPYMYLYSGFGENLIKLFPTPTEDLAADTADLYGSSISKCCIVEYYAFADPTLLQLPSWIRQRLIKAFVCYKCLSQEGPGQDLISAGDWKAELERLLGDFQRLNSGIFVAKMRTRSPNANVFGTKISRPRLPTNFGFRDEN